MKKTLKTLMFDLDETINQLEIEVHQLNLLVEYNSQYFNIPVNVNENKEYQKRIIYLFEKYKILSSLLEDIAIDASQSMNMTMNIKDEVFDLFMKNLQIEYGASEHDK